MCIFQHVFFQDLFMYLFLPVLGLWCCTWAFSSCSKRGLLFVVVPGLRMELLSHDENVDAVGACRLQWLRCTGSAAVARGLTCSRACGNFLAQGSNPCPLHWGIPDSEPLDHQESPQHIILNPVSLRHLLWLQI